MENIDNQEKKSMKVDERKREETLETIEKLKNSAFGDVVIDCDFGDLNYNLMLLTSDCAEDEDLMKLLADWREKHEFWFPAQFEVTMKGTAKWFKEKVIDVPDRLLFIIKAGNEYIGHIGLFRLNQEGNDIELDNIVRGGNEYPGIMANALANLMDWAGKKLSIQGYELQVASDNEKAIKLYENLGFIETKRTPLIYEKIGDGGRWVDAPSDHSGEIKRYNVFMKLGRKK